MAGLNGYVPLRRGILEHLGGMGDNEVKVYVALLCLARIGDGTVSMNAHDLAELLSMRLATLCDNLRKLSEPHGKDGTRYIEWERAKNQHGVGKITILKYPRAGTPYATATVTAPVTAAGQQPDSSRTAAGQHTAADLRKAAPQELRELGEREEKTLAPSGAKKVKCVKCDGTGRGHIDDDPNKPRCFCDTCNGTGAVAA